MFTTVCFTGWRARACVPKPRPFKSRENQCMVTFHVHSTMKEINRADISVHRECGTSRAEMMYQALEAHRNTTKRLDRWAEFSGRHSFFLEIQTESILTGISFE